MLHIGHRQIVNLHRLRPGSQCDLRPGGIEAGVLHLKQNGSIRIHQCCLSVVLLLRPVRRIGHARLFQQYRAYLNIIEEDFCRRAVIGTAQGEPRIVLKRIAVRIRKPVGCRRNGQAVRRIAFDTDIQPVLHGYDTDAGAGKRRPTEQPAAVFRIPVPFKVVEAHIDIVVRRVFGRELAGHLAADVYAAVLDVHHVQPHRQLVVSLDVVPCTHVRVAGQPQEIPRFSL